MAALQVNEKYNTIKENIERHGGEIITKPKIVTKHDIIRYLCGGGCGEEVEQASDALLITARKPESKAGKCKICNSREGARNRSEPKETSTTSSTSTSKYSFQKIKEQIENNGGEILNDYDDSYIYPSSELIHFKCGNKSCLKEQRELAKSFVDKNKKDEYKGLCKKCVKSVVPTNFQKKYSYEDAVEIFKDRNAKLLVVEKDYDGLANTTMRFKCDCGSISSTSITNKLKQEINQGLCKNCETKTLKKDFLSIEEWFKEYDCILETSEDQYKNQDTVLYFVCSCGTRNTTTWKLGRRGLPCTECKSKSDKTKITNLEKWGCENVFQNEEIKKRCRETCIDNYGVPYCMMNKEIMEKANITNKEKNNGVHNLATSDVRDKAKKAAKEKYGVEYPLQSSEIKEKCKITTKKKYGVEYPLQSKEILNKIKVIIKEKYGVEFYIISQHWKDECKLRYGSEYFLHTEQFYIIMKEKYGVKHAMHNQDLFHKQQQSSFAFKRIQCPDGQIREFQGYEYETYLDLLEKYKPEEICLSVEETVPTVEYCYKEKNHNGVYYPDFYIPHENLIVETKSTWTMEKDYGKNMAKFEAVTKKGYNMLVYIYGNNMKTLELYYLEAAVN